MTDRYICIHGHFYQPPRENPWLESLEVQDSAYPYHDWNERVTAEGYEPNSVSRILDEQGRIVRIVNNYSQISFNFGPTLLAWLKPHAPEVYQAILQADRDSQKAFSGHGSALAQAYNHIILPLAHPRDKYTQVFWGVRDFEHHFGRPPQGMWLPETAVDLETLDIMAGLGIRFTILSPDQAQRVRPLGSAHWEDVFGGNIDPTMAYLQRLPSGRAINLFFRHDPLSRAVAFEGLLRSGEDFARSLLSAFTRSRAGPQLVHIATDGEIYGHHHRFGDMALAFALDYIQSRSQARLTNYGEFLAKHSPTHEVEILENTSWSCPHGVERWRADCGCHTGAHPGWNQAWRAPLREALDWLRDTLAPKYEEKAAQLLIDPWAARNDYIAVLLDRSPQSLQHFLGRHALHPLTQTEVVTALKLLELQRQALLMFTSCGWFFADISGIETQQLLQYAGRALQLAQEVLGIPLESPFLERLEPAWSNLPEYGHGADIYHRYVKAAIVDLPKVAAHYAITSLFEEYGRQAQVHCYVIDREDYQSYEAGKAKLAVGRVRCTSQITRESAVFSFGVLHLGDHTLNVGVRDYPGQEADSLTAQEVSRAFYRADFPQALRLLDKHFGPSIYYLKSLFRDEQRQVLGRILESTLAGVEGQYHHIYESNYPLMLFLADIGIPFPKAFSAAADFILNADLRRAFSSGALDPNIIRGLLEEARAWGVSLDSQGLGHELSQTLSRMMGKFVAAPEDLSLLKSLGAAVPLARSLPFSLNLWKAQNLYFEVLRKDYPEFRQRAKQGEEAAQEWVKQFTTLAEQLAIHPP